MKRRVSLFVICAVVSVGGCGRPAGKADLKADPQLRARILAACADGTHSDAQECSNARAIENADKLDRSLGRK